MFVNNKPNDFDTDFMFKLFRETTHVIIILYWSMWSSWQWQLEIVNPSHFFKFKIYNSILVFATLSSGEVEIIIDFS